MRDFKSAQAGEKRSEAIGRGLEPEDLELIFVAPETVNEADEQPPTFEDEPWPDPVEDVPIEGPAEPKKQDVLELAKTAGHSMTNTSTELKPPILGRLSSEPSPSDRTWIETIKKILRPAGFRALSAPRVRGLVRPSIEGQGEEKQR